MQADSLRTEGTEYPIAVRRFTAEQALTIICERCHTEAVITADELLNEGLYECPGDTEKGRLASTEPRCRGSACMKYEEGSVCPNCNRLGWFGNDGSCSRACKLQVDYAKSLWKEPA